MSRAAACASGWPGSRIRARGWAGGIRWCSCWAWRCARSPRPGTTRRRPSRSGRLAACTRHWPSWAAPRAAQHPHRPAAGISWPHAAQVLRIRRHSGPARGPWTHKEIAYGITSLPEDLAGSRHLATYARRHWDIENREHYVRDKTFGEDLQRVRTGNQPNALAAIRNLVTGALRRAGFANIAHARRYYGRDDQRILSLYGYT
jgi:hypothetical protein